MKLLPWTLLSLILVCSIVFGQVGPTTGFDKVYGVPAAAEWLDLESGQNGQPGTTFQVPPGRVLSLVYRFMPPDGGGTIAGTVDVDGVTVANFTDPPARLVSLHISSQANPLLYGETAAAGQIVTVTRTGGTAPNADTFFIRGWLEPLP